MCLSNVKLEVGQRVRFVHAEGRGLSPARFGDEGTLVRAYQSRDPYDGSAMQRWSIKWDAHDGVDEDWPDYYLIPGERHSPLALIERPNEWIGKYEII